MITTLFLTLVNLILSLLITILPEWTVWPATLTTGLNYLFGQLATFNFLFPVDTLFTVLLFIINFEVLYLTAKLATKLINFLRGSGGIDL